MCFEVIAILCGDGNIQFPKRRVVLCVVTVEKVLINITDTTNVQPLSKICIIQPGLLFVSSANSLRTVICAFHESRNFIFIVKTAVTASFPVLRRIQFTSYQPAFLI
jgi:hypothetical protein